MIQTTTLPHLERAVNEESWSFLRDNYPLLSDAIEKEVAAGKTADEIAYGMMRMTQRPAASLRCRQAAQYLIDESGVRTADDLPRSMIV